MEASSTISVVVVSRPGILRQSLLTSLAAFPWVTIVGEAGDGLNALNLVALRRPRLLVIDANLLDEEVETLLASVKAHHPQIGCLAVLHSNNRVRALVAAGADGIILRDSSWAELSRALIEAAHAV